MSDETPTPRPRPRPQPVPQEDAPFDPAALPAEDTAPAEDAPAAAAPPDIEALQRRLTLLSWVPAAVLAVVAIVLLVLGLSVWGLSWSFGKKHGPDVQQRQEQVLAAAKSCLSTLNSFDYTKINANLSADRACLTGSFEQTFVRGFNATVGKYAVNEKASQTVQINQAGVQTVNAAGTTWTVLLYGQTNTVKTGTSSSDPDIAPFGALVTMKLAATSWKVSYYTADTHGLDS